LRRAFSFPASPDAVSCSRSAIHPARRAAGLVMSSENNMLFCPNCVCGFGISFHLSRRALIFRRILAVQKSVENVYNSLKSAAKVIFMSRIKAPERVRFFARNRRFSICSPLVKRKYFTKIRRKNVLSGEL
jgi:hypothetical protein